VRSFVAQLTFNVFVNTVYRCYMKKYILTVVLRCVQIYIPAVVRHRFLSPEVNISRRQMTSCCWVTCHGRRGRRRMQQRQQRPLTTATPCPPYRHHARRPLSSHSFHLPAIWGWATPWRRSGATVGLSVLEEMTLIVVWRRWDVVWTIHRCTRHRQPAGTDPEVIVITV